MINSELFSILLAFVSAITAGLIGSFALMKRMTLAGDAVSHIALPGIGIALLMHLNPLLGGATALLIGTLLIWNLEQKTNLATETAVGVIFSASLAIGALVTPSAELEEALFGNFQALSLHNFLIHLLLAVVIIGFLIRYRHQLILALFSPDLARTAGVRIKWLNLFYLLAFSGTVILGLQFLGALLMGSLIIIPAAVSRQLTHQLKSFLTMSVLVSIVSVGLGFITSSYYGWQLGPTVVTIAAAIFVLSLLKKKK